MTVPRWLDQAIAEFLAKGDNAQRAVDCELAAAAWNAKHQVGSEVRFWPGTKEGPGKLSRTATPAMVLAGHTTVLWVRDHSGCLALSHIEPVYPAGSRP